MSKSRILVIEDEEPVRSSILDLLDVEGYSATGAEDGVIGIALARQQKPDLIICDVMMPQIDGYEVLAQLRQNADTATIPFIFLTVKTGTGPLKEGMNLGADDYLSKPFKRIKLLKAVNVRLSKRASIEVQTVRQLEDLRANITQMLPHEFLTPVSVLMLSSEILIKHQSALDAAQRLEIAARINSTAELCAA